VNSKKPIAFPSNTPVRPPTKQLARANVLGVGVHAIDLTQAAALIEGAIVERRKGYVCVTGVHGVMEAYRHKEFQSVLDRALLVTPDGIPLVWVGRAQGYSQMRRVFGPDLMLEVCRHSMRNKCTHFLYGGKPGVADDLRDTLTRWFPGISVVGTFTPPFRPLLPDEQARLEDTVAKLAPDIIWVGLSTPKQEQFMAQNIDRLASTLMIGVGAAFDIHTGNLKDAPEWVKKAGLQWVHRLCQEPSRLWKRYLVNNSTFLLHIGLQLSGLRHYELRRDTMRV
jgi:N-acetylglucosaminyldiphosphoundecaprenol N-acetyl-beta-D-mannosaminyltransferase